MAELATTPDQSTAARITDETAPRLRQRLGIPTRYMNRPWYSEASFDAIRHHALCKGDDNPLYTDEAYGAASCWGSIIGAPNLERNIAKPFPYEPTEEEKQLTRGGDPLAGISAYMSGTEWEFWRPVRLGDRLVALSAVTAVQEKKSEYAGRTILTWNGSVFINQDGIPTGLRNFVFVHAERETARKKGKYAHIERTQYDDAMLAEIDAAYEAEYVRGAVPRFWEDVTVGEELPRLVRGPLLVADIMVVHMTSGPGFYGSLNSTKLSYKNRKRVPKFYSRNTFGAWDSAQRCHWEDDWAQRVGQPFAYDYGYMRDDWAVTALTNWGGDAAWLWKYKSSIRRFNYIGDTHWFTGRVVEKVEMDGLAAVTIELSGANQRGEATITANAQIVLPRRGQQRATLPELPGAGKATAMEVLQAIVKR